MASTYTSNDSDTFVQYYKANNKPVLQQNFEQTERWISLIGGGALALYGIGRLDVPGTMLALLGGGFLYNGITGRFVITKAMNSNTNMSRILATNISTIPGGKGFRTKRALTINRPPQEVYAFWRDVEKAPLYMPHIQTVTKTGERTSHWIALDHKHQSKVMEWNSEILEDEVGRLISWHVQGKPMGISGGRVHFQAAPVNRGTIVTLELDFPEPNTAISMALGKIAGPFAEHETLETLRRFKEILEAGEVPTTEGQPTGKGRK